MLIQGLFKTQVALYRRFCRCFVNKLAK